MSSIAPSVSSSLLPTRLPASSAAKASHSSSLGSGGSAGAGSSASASGDTTTYVTNADGSLSITTTNAQGQIVSVTTTQPLATQFAGTKSAGQGVDPGALINRLL